MLYKDALMLVAHALECQRVNLKLKSGGTTPGCAIHYRKWPDGQEYCGEVYVAVDALWNQIELMNVAIKVYFSPEERKKLGVGA